MNELRAFADGHWAAFAGLDTCPLALADAELGPPLEDVLHGGRFGGGPAQFRRYAATDAAPGGVTGWVLGDVVIGLEMRHPTPSPSSLDDLGEPEAVISSELGLAWQQQLWAGRGLVLHRRDAVIAVAFGLAPFQPAAWESDPLRWWRVERRPRRP